MLLQRILGRDTSLSRAPAMRQGDVAIALLEPLDQPHACDSSTRALCRRWLQLEDPLREFLFLWRALVAFKMLVYACLEVESSPCYRERS